LVSILNEDDKVVVSLACDVLSLMAKQDNVRVVANKMNIVAKLVKKIYPFLPLPNVFLFCKREE
jgi:hypothetical protein